MKSPQNVTPGNSRNAPRGTPRDNEGINEKLRSDGWVMVFRHRQSRTTYHRQAGIELNFSVEGEGTLWLAGKPLPLRPRTAILFDGRLPHMLSTDESRPYSRTVVCFTPPFSSREMVAWLRREGPHCMLLDRDAWAEIDRICRQMVNELTLRPRDWQALSRALLCELLVRLRRAFDAGSQEQSQDAPGRLVRLAAEYTQKNLELPLSLEDVARHFQVTREHLTRSFHRQLGMPYHQYVLQQRIAEARRLLAESPDLSLTEIGLRVGFGSSSTFSRVFRRLTAQSPSQCRASTTNEV